MEKTVEEGIFCKLTLPQELAVSSGKETLIKMPDPISNLRLRGNCGREHCCPLDSKFSKKTGDG
jgi:hypothetical protein